MATLTLRTRPDRLRRAARLVRHIAEFPDFQGYPYLRVMLRHIATEIEATLPGSASEEIVLALIAYIRTHRRVSHADGCPADSTYAMGRGNCTCGKDWARDLLAAIDEDDDRAGGTPC